MPGYRTSTTSGETSGTGNRTCTIPVVANDLVVVAVKWSGNASNAPTCTDDQAGGTYDLITTALNNASADIMAVFVRKNFPTGSVTATITPVAGGGGSNTAGQIVAVAVSGMRRAGSTSVRGFGKQENQTSGVPTPTLPASALTSNMTIMVAGSTTTTGSVPPTAWTERQDASQSTPTTAIEVATRDGGFTGNATAYVSIASSVWSAAILELDSTASLSGSLSESFSFSDVMARAAKYLRPATESLSFLDSLSPALTLISRFAKVTWAQMEVPTRGAVAWVGALPESFSLADTLSRNVTYTRPRQEAFAFSDLASRTAVLSRQMADIFTFSDSSSRMASYARSVLESFSFLDSLGAALTLISRFAKVTWAQMEVPFPSGGVTNWVGSLAEVFSFSDILSRTASYRRASFESLLLSDAVSRSGSLGRSAAESFSLSDSVSRGLGLARSLQEALTFSDLVARAAKYLRSLQESFSFSDAVAYVQQGLHNFARGLAESFAMTDTLSRFVVYRRAQQESFAFSDVIQAVQSGLHNFVKNLSEVFPFSDSITRQLLASRFLQEALSFSDSVARAAKYLRAAAETLSIGSFDSGSFSSAFDIGSGTLDSLSRMLSMSRGVSESFAFSDSMTRLFKGARSVIESLAFSDLLAGIKSGSHAYLGNLSEAFAFSDSVARGFFGRRGLAETLSISDAVAYIQQGLHSFVRILAESFAMGDFLATHSSLSRSLQDSGSFSDVLSKVLLFARNVQETFSFSDAISKTIALSRSVFDVLGFSDSVARAARYARTAQDALLFSDSVAEVAAGITHYFRVLAESFSFFDSAGFFIPIPKIIANLIVSLFVPGGKALLSSAKAKLLNLITLGGKRS